MKSPVTGMEVRWRLAGDSAWNTKRFAPSDSIELPDTVRGGAYEIEVCNLGLGGLASEWVGVPFVMPETNREGAAALPPVVYGNVSSRWTAGASVSYTATDTEAIVSVSAGTMQVGDKQVAYAGSSASVEGTPEQTITLWLYYDDFHAEGGSRTLGVTTDSVESMADTGRVLIAPVTIKFAAAGGSTGGSGDIGGGGGGTGGGKPTPPSPIQEVPV